MSRNDDNLSLIQKLREQIKQAEAVCDSYATENQQFSTMIERLRAALESQRLAAVRFEADCETLRTDNDRLRAALEGIANKMRAAYPGCPCKELARKAPANEREGK